MTTRRRIHVRVSPHGQITVEADGFHGKGCVAATKVMEEVLGKARARTRKPEFWRQARSRRNSQQLGG